MNNYTRKMRRINSCSVYLSVLEIPEIAAVCAVSLQTAGHWKRGNRDPSPQAEELLRLHADGKVLPDAPGWQNTRVTGEKLECEGYTLSPAEIGQAGYYRALHDSALREIRALEKRVQQAEEYIAYLEQYADRAAVVPLDTSKGRPSLAGPAAQGNPYFAGRRRS